MRLEGGLNEKKGSSSTYKRLLNNVRGEVLGQFYARLLGRMGHLNESNASAKERATQYFLSAYRLPVAWLPTAHHLSISKLFEQRDVFARRLLYIQTIYIRSRADAYIPSLDALIGSLYI